MSAKLFKTKTASRTKSSKNRMTGHVDCFTAWGLAAGEHAFYAESLGQLYLFLTGAFLDRLGTNDVENALILNFHVGLNCQGEYAVRTDAGALARRFSFSLTNSNSNGLIQRIGEIQKKQGRFTLAVCSAAVVVESYMHADVEMKRFMSRDYESSKPLGLPELEVAVMKRLDELALETSNLKLRVFHTAADLPLTAVYLKFSRPVAPTLPSNAMNTKAAQASRGKKIIELLATGLYDSRYATDVVQEKGDINLPVQILVAGNSQHDAPIREQIGKLRDVYCKHIKQHAVRARDTDAGYHTTHIFISHYSEDAGLAKALKERIEAFAAEKNLRCKCILGIGAEMAASGRAFLANLNELARLIDYAVVLHPLRKVTRHNIPYELGLFSERFVTRDDKGTTISSRATLVAKPSDIVKDLSNWSGIPHVKRPTSDGINNVDMLFKELAKKIPFLNDT